MNEKWDVYPSNILESGGLITRYSFIFRYSRFEVWKNGSCVNSGSSENSIFAELSGKTLNITLNDRNLDNYIINNFSFFEISHSMDRVLWSKDMKNDGIKLTELKNPDFCSLFYKNGKLNKVTFTIRNPNSLIEFYL